MCDNLAHVFFPLSLLVNALSAVLCKWVIGVVYVYM